ncbi:SAG-related sequence SRS17B [Toxoplasma gondii FOU]|uniref:SAG-related sequence SRS17B n=1 Tax=Toxoplasma gondii FOU TaxID=943167 RepID=A0A086KHM4_TOXGO|nr:SAG-related sequence SRS17B [Toxoplasma gondii FOU]
MASQKVLVCLTVAGCLLATFHTFCASVSAASAGEANNPDNTGKVPDTKIDLDPDDIRDYVVYTLGEVADPLQLDSQECPYREDGSVGHLDLTISSGPGVAFHCPGKKSQNLSPTELDTAFGVDAAGNCDTTRLVDVSTLIPTAIVRGPQPSTPSLEGSSLLLTLGLPLDSDKKACFVCRENGNAAGRSCIVTVTVKKASLPSSRVCNPAVPPNGNMLAFDGDGSDRSVVVHCPKGLPVLDIFKESDNVWAGPRCMAKAKLEDVVGSGSTVKPVNVDSQNRDVSRSYLITSTSSFSKPRILCMACMPGDRDPRQDEGLGICIMQALLPASEGRRSEGGQSRNQNPGDSLTPVTNSGGGIISFTTTAAFFCVISGLMAAVM